MAFSRTRWISLVAAVGILGLGACGAIEEPAQIIPTEASIPIPTLTVLAAAPEVVASPLPTIAALEVPATETLKYFWPSQSDLPVSRADWNPTGWDFTLSTPEFSYGEPDYVGIMLSGGSLAPQLPEIGQLGALAESRSIRGLPGFYESSGFGFRLAWEEDGQRYSMNVLGLTEAEALTIAETLELLTAEELATRLKAAK